MKVVLRKRVLLTTLLKTLPAGTKKERKKIKRLVKEGWKVVIILDD